MDFITLIFKLLERFVPMAPAEHQKLMHEAKDWQTGLNPEEGFGKIYSQVNNHWFFRTSLAILFIPISRMIVDYSRPQDLDND